MGPQPGSIGLAPPYRSCKDRTSHANRSSTPSRGRGLRAGHSASGRSRECPHLLERLQPDPKGLQQRGEGGLQGRIRPVRGRTGHLSDGVCDRQQRLRSGVFGCERCLRPGVRWGRDLSGGLRRRFCGLPDRVPGLLQRRPDDVSRSREGCPCRGPTPLHGQPYDLQRDLRLGRRELREELRQDETRPGGGCQAVRERLQERLHGRTRSACVHAKLPEDPEPAVPALLQPGSRLHRDDLHPAVA